MHRDGMHPNDTHNNDLHLLSAIRAVRSIRYAYGRFLGVLDWVTISYHERYAHAIL